MEIKGISWVGRRAGNLKASRSFFQDALGLKPFQASDEQDMAMFQLPSGQFFELMGLGSPWHKYLSRTVIAFEVDDVPSVRKELEEKGVEFVSENFQDGGFIWAFFRGPDGYLYELMSKPDGA